jgi:isoamylase
MYERRSPLHSVNFITCHDGFTLYDLVSHNHKHNDLNGEGNRDGANENLSWNCGAEGDTDNAAILALRKRQTKNFMAILFLSQGVPMILAGDEVLQSQHGNNNAYCQDNELAWFNWRLVESNRDMLRFMRELIALRRRHPSLRRRRFLRGEPASGSNLPDIAWHGEHLNEPRWQDSDSRLLAFTLAGATPDEKPLHVILNMWHEPRSVAVPVIGGFKWRRALDTAIPSPNDIVPLEQQREIVSFICSTEPRSVVVLEAV